MCTSMNVLELAALIAEEVFVHNVGLLGEAGQRDIRMLVAADT